MRERITSELSGSSPLVVEKDIAHWGLASLLMGGFLMLGALITLVVNLLFWSVGPRGIPMHLAFLGCVIGLAAVVGLNIVSLLFGIRGWQQAQLEQRPAGLPIAGTLTSSVALIGWVGVGLDLLAIIHSFMP